MHRVENKIQNVFARTWNVIAKILEWIKNKSVSISTLIGKEREIKMRWLNVKLKVNKSNINPSINILEIEKGKISTPTAVSKQT